ncbi:hypothetical protein SM39_0421 [Serratia marcescens SM39]|uniref:Uncharacterized protein n=1 Tax=Serratia marcescens SM39 TaxID=1334564 RepID=A0AAT9E7V8_SERMA|nr:hypothetical protein SM39_0421 [Serratia marcescens SM39]
MCRDVAGRVPTHFAARKTLIPVIPHVDKLRKRHFARRERESFPLRRFCPSPPVTKCIVANRSDDGEKIAFISLFVGQIMTQG